MLTQFPLQKSPEAEVLKANLQPKIEDDFQAPINLETIETDNMSMKSVKMIHSTESLIKSALSNKNPMNFETNFMASSISKVPSKNKVQFDLSEKSEEKVEPSKSPRKCQVGRITFSKDDLLKLPEKPKHSLNSPNFPRSASAGETKGGIFEQRKKMFEKRREIEQLHL